MDYHTVENRAKRKTSQERRNVLKDQMERLGREVQQGQLGANELYQSIEASLQLAEHAETWEWKEAVSSTAMAPASDAEAQHSEAD